MIIKILNDYYYSVFIILNNYYFFTYPPIDTPIAPKIVLGYFLFI